MKLTTINVQITKTPKQYEAVRIGAEAELQDGENMRNAIKALRNELEDIYAEMYPPKQPAQPTAPAAEAKKDEPKKREPLKFEDPRVQQAVARMEQNPNKKREIYDNMLKYFEPDAGALKTLKLAAAVV